MMTIYQKSQVKHRSPLKRCILSAGRRRRTPRLGASIQRRPIAQRMGASQLAIPHKGNLRRMLPEAWGRTPAVPGVRPAAPRLQVAADPCRLENVPSSSRELDPDPLVGFFGFMAIIRTTVPVFRNISPLHAPVASSPDPPPPMQVLPAPVPTTWLKNSQ